MSSIRNPFGKRGVPKSADALRALGVEDGKQGDVKGEDVEEIELTEAEEHMIDRDPIWNREQLDAWIADLDIDDFRKRQLQQLFHFEDSEIGEALVYASNSLDLGGSSTLEQVPPYLHVRQLLLSHSNVKRIPSGVIVQELHLSFTPIEFIAHDVKVKFLWIDNASYERIRPQIEALDPVPRLFIA